MLNLTHRVGIEISNVTAYADVVLVVRISHKTHLFQNIHAPSHMSHCILSKDSLRLVFIQHLSFEDVGNEILILGRVFLMSFQNTVHIPQM